MAFGCFCDVWSRANGCWDLVERNGSLHLPKEELASDFHYDTGINLRLLPSWEGFWCIMMIRSDTKGASTNHSRRGAPKQL